MISLIWPALSETYPPELDLDCWFSLLPLTEFELDLLGPVCSPSALDGGVGVSARTMSMPYGILNLFPRHNRVGYRQYDGCELARLVGFEAR